MAFGTHVDLTRFGAYRPSYRNQRSIIEPTANADNDGMDVDDDDPAPVDLFPSHALDLLHLQVLEHFTTLLLELVARVAGPEVLRKTADNGASASKYAPTWAKKHYLNWSARDCLEYLDTKKPLNQSSPRLDLFLTYPYASGAGARRGQEWSRKDWAVALGALKALGDMWQEKSFEESLALLLPHLEAIFEAPMRPTGIGNTFR